MYNVFNKKNIIVFSAFFTHTTPSLAYYYFYVVVFLAEFLPPFRRQIRLLQPPNYHYKITGVMKCLFVIFSISLFSLLSTFLSINLSIYQSINLSIYQSINLSIYQSINLSNFLILYSFHYTPPRICWIHLQGRI